MITEEKSDLTDKNDLLSEARDIMARQDLPPIFINRLLDLVAENFKAEDIAFAQIPAIKKGPIYLLVFGVSVMVMVSAFLSEFSSWPVWESYSIAGLVALIFAFLGFRMAEKSVRGITLEDDALAMMARVFESDPKLGFMGWAYRNQLKRLRRKPPMNDNDVDEYLREFGWKSVGGKTFLLASCLIYLVTLITLLYQKKDDFLGILN